jgi:hypothetical protein
MSEIIFDFDNDCIVDLEPTFTPGTNGFCNHKDGRNYIGAKNVSELLGILAHELTHLAMQVCYDNECSPYEKPDEQTKSDFDKIVSLYCNKDGIDKIVQRVFIGYDKSIWPAELIVRVPHLLAHYNVEKVIHLLTQQAPDLFKFYLRHTDEDLRRFVENHAYIKARRKIQHLNILLGKMDKYEHSKIRLKN